jgi:hypothetical protein
MPDVYAGITDVDAAAVEQVALTHVLPHCRAARGLACARHASDDGSGHGEQ